MINLIMILLILSLIPMILMLLNFLISKKSFQDREKTSPFECGFDPLSKNHLPFSIHFFLISLIFLIFDIEITLLIPLVYLMNFLNFFLILTSMFFFIILIISLLMEYTEQAIDWKI